MELPKKKTIATRINPKLLIIFGKPKCGKTTLLSMLENNLIIDLEDGTDSVDALRVKAPTLVKLLEVHTALKEAKSKLKEDEYPYEYITLDTATSLEDMILPLAKKLYKETPMGKSFTSSDVRTLPNGAGYLYIRNAYLLTLNMFRKLTPHLILLGHTKDKSINKNGKELSENVLDLAGKLERIVSAQADALGYMYRVKNKTILNFKGGEDSIVEARPLHLRGKEIILGESDADNVITDNWDKVFI